MQSIDLIRENLANSTDRVLAKVEEMREHALVAPTPNGGAHTLWTLGHLAFIEGLVIDEFMRGRKNPLASWKDAFDGDDVSADAERYPPFADVLDACRRMRGATMSLLDELTEAALDSVSAAHPEGTGAMFGTYRRCFQFVADHWYMHRGQLADARRAAGIDRMWF